MAKYSKGAGKKVEKVMHEMHEGKLKSGRSNKKVTNPKQAVAIGLSEARKEGAKVPKKSSSKSAAKKTGRKKSAPKKASKSSKKYAKRT
jgi:hypothetical protein